MALPTTSPAMSKRRLPCATATATCIGAALVTLLLLSVQARMQMSAAPAVTYCCGVTIEDLVWQPLP